MRSFILWCARIHQRPKRLLGVALYDFKVDRVGRHTICGASEAAAPLPSLVSPRVDACRLLLLIPLFAGLYSLGHLSQLLCAFVYVQVGVWMVILVKIKYYIYFILVLRFFIFYRFVDKCNWFQAFEKEWLYRLGVYKIFRFSIKKNQKSWKFI